MRPWRGAPKWLVAAAFFELFVGGHNALTGNLLGVVVDGFGFCACLTAAALMVHSRVLEDEHRRRREAWEEHIRGR